MMKEKKKYLLQLFIDNLIELLSFSYDLTEEFEASSNKLGKMIYNHYQVQSFPYKVVLHGLFLQAHYFHPHGLQRINALIPAIQYYQSLQQDHLDTLLNSPCLRISIDGGQNLHLFWSNKRSLYFQIPLFLSLRCIHPEAESMSPKVAIEVLLFLQHKSICLPLLFQLGYMPLSQEALQVIDFPRTYCILLYNESRHIFPLRSIVANRRNCLISLTLALSKILAPAEKLFVSLNSLSYLFLSEGKDCFNIFDLAFEAHHCIRFLLFVSLAWGLIDQLVICRTPQRSFGLLAFYRSLLRVL